MIRKIMAICFVCVCLAVPALAAEAAQPAVTTVQVSGSSQQEVSPDVVKIQANIQAFSQDVEQAKQESEQVLQQLLLNLRKQGIHSDQLKSNHYRIEPQYQYEKDRLPKLKGYRVVNSIEVTGQVEQTGLLVQQLTQSGVNEIQAIRFEKADESAAKSQALEAAVADALNKARVIAGALHKNISNVKLVSEGDVYYRPVLLESRAYKAGANDAVAPSIPAGNISVGANVQVTVELE